MDIMEIGEQYYPIGIYYFARARFGEKTNQFDQSQKY